MLPPSLQHIVKPQDRMLLEVMRFFKSHQPGQVIRQSSNRNFSITQGRKEKSGNITTRTGISGDRDVSRRTQTISGLGFTQSERKSFSSHDPVDLQSTQRDLGIQHQTPRGGSFFSQGGSRGRRSSGGGGRRKSAGVLSLFPRSANLIGKVVDSKWAKPITVPFNWLSSRI